MQPNRIPPTPGPARMTLAHITRGKQERPLRVIVYGVEGVGKTSFGASAPKPLFLCSEDGTAHLESFAARLRSGESAERARETQEALAAWLATQAPRPEVDR